MKKILTSLFIIASMIATPVLARDHDRYDRRDNGKDAALIIGGALLGAIIISSIDNDRDRDYRYNREYRYRDRNYYDRNGRYYNRRVCVKEHVYGRHGYRGVRTVCR